MLYTIEQPPFVGCLLREAGQEPLVDQVRVLLDTVERQQSALPSWLQDAFAPWLVSTRRWIDDPANVADEELLREILERLRSYNSIAARLARRCDRR